MKSILLDIQSAVVVVVFVGAITTAAILQRLEQQAALLPLLVKIVKPDYRADWGGLLLLFGQTTDSHVVIIVVGRLSSVTCHGHGLIMVG